MSALDRVAVGFDGSDDSIVALRWAAELCASLDATLIVVHVVGLLEEQHLGTAGPATVDVAVSIARAAGQPAERVEWYQLSGSPSEALLRASTAPHSVDLLVVGSRGAGLRPEMLLGSTSLELAEHAMIPVVIVPNAL